MKIKKGDLINELSLPAIDGSVFDLQFVQGQKLMISFYRYSSCPFCSSPICKNFLGLCWMQMLSAVGLVGINNVNHFFQNQYLIP